MKDYERNYPDRKMHVWWYADDEQFTAYQVQGFECHPDNPDTWWCPEAGYSCSVGFCLFETESEAKHVLLLKAEEQQKFLNLAIARLGDNQIAITPGRIAAKTNNQSGGATTAAS